MCSMWRTLLLAVYERLRIALTPFDYGKVCFRGNQYTNPLPVRR